MIQVRLVYSQRGRLVRIAPSSTDDLRAFWKIG